jgi:hypothetical protein
MKIDNCATVQERLGPFVDGELTGAERLALAYHIDRCSACAAERDALRSIGDLVRTALPSETQFPELAGLAAGVVSRSRAEAALSWRGWFERASEDWHWVIVGAGSLAATLVSALLLSAILAFGPAPERQDSLAGFYTANTPGVVLAYATRMPLEQDIRLLAEQQGPALPQDDITWTAATYWPRVEAQLVQDLAYQVSRSGKPSRPGVDDPSDRLIQEALLEEITRLRLAQPMMIGRPASTQVAVSSAISLSPRGLLR